MRTPPPPTCRQETSSDPIAGGHHSDGNPPDQRPYRSDCRFRSSRPRPKPSRWPPSLAAINSLIIGCPANTHRDSKSSPYARQRTLRRLEVITSPRTPWFSPPFNHAGLCRTATPAQHVCHATEVTRTGKPRQASRRAVPPLRRRTTVSASRPFRV